MDPQIRTLAQTGGRGRAACAKASEAGPDLTVALKRALPFLARKRLAVTFETARCLSFADLAAEDAIVYTSAFLEKSNPHAPSKGLVLFDEAGLARVLDGALGGGAAVTLPSLKLTAAQNALASRVSAGILRALGEALSTRLGLTVEATPNRDIEAGAAIVIALNIEGGGQISVALPLVCIKVTEESVAEPKDDPALVAAMNDVELDIVAELGKVRLSLSVIAKLQVGDVIRLQLPLDEKARVCAGGAVLFHGRPTASGDVVAVALERQMS